MNSRAQPHSVALMATVTDDNFNEGGYLSANPDVASAVKDGAFASGRKHFDLFDKSEGRRQPASADAEFRALKQAKMSRIEQVLDHSQPHTRHDDAIDFLTDELRETF